jgi:ABC-2 type transport system ATP-binding protein
MIAVENLSKYYDGFCAVDGISFKMAGGEILGLLGPNGAGKTTTLRMLTGYLRPSSGTIRVKGLDMAEDPVAIKRLMGYLPESAPLYPGMLVYDYLTYVADLRGLRGEAREGRIRELVALCSLWDIMAKPIGDLSKGLKQRVGLAHAMMSDPEILILDEPTSGLDPNQIVEIRDIIRRIGRQKTIILSTHILSEAEATCDRIVIINSGRIAVDDRTENLKRTAGQEHHIHLRLRNAAPGAVRERLAALEGVLRVEVETPEGDGSLPLKLICRGDRDRRDDIYRDIRATDWILIELYQRSRDLETVFRELTKES